ncbi:beta transducin [Maudiozyma exigua]|uniref:Beta transducin n=1 Tax=Maudiozyma exigua TaxID=34358 RepID=A0A9P6WCE5_MAUEX|nr:beta transducin [Kazachstania exigua]
MVKSYQRFEQEAVFGVIDSNSNSVWLPPTSTEKSTNPGELITSALENVNIWNIKTGELDSFLTDGVPLGSIDTKSAKPAEVTYLKYHKDTNLLAVGYADGVIKVWDLMSKSVLLSFNGHKSAITTLEFDVTGTRLISGSRDSNIIVWDLVSEIGLYKLRSHKDNITGLWCENEDWLISTSKDGLIKIWDLKVQQCVETHIAHTGECWALGIHNDLVVTTGSDSQVKVWQLNLENNNGSKLTEKGIHEKQSKQRGLDVQFKTTTDGVTFFFIQNADKTIEIFRIRKDEEISRALKKREKRLSEKGMTEEEIALNIKTSYVSLIMHPFQIIRSLYKVKSACWTYATQSKLELVVTTSSNTIEYYSVPYEKRDPIQPVPSKPYSIELQGLRTDIRAIDISDDTKLLATASNGLLKIWNLKTKLCIRTFECGFALTCKFLPGGLLVVVGTRNGELQLFDLASSTQLENIEEAHDAAIWSLDITNDGKKLVTGSADKTVKFWEFKLDEQLIPGTTNKFMQALKLHHDTTMELNDDILSIKLSPDDKYLAVSLLDNTVKIFFMDTMKFFLSLYGHKLPVLSIDISFDSKLVITSSADKNIKIWGLDFGDCHKSLFAHQDSIMNVKFVPESHNFFSCSKDGLVKYWDGDKFECIQKLAGHQSEVWALAMANDASFVVSTSHDHSIRVWAETEDEVFLEEEREKEMEEQYEETLLNSLEEGNGDDAFKKDAGEANDGDDAGDVHKQTIESLKASERLMEALDLGISEIDKKETYDKEMKQWNKKKTGEAPIAPQGNAILLAIKKTPVEYIMDTLVRIKPSQMEDALLVFPFSYTLKFLQFIDIALADSKLSSSYLPLICKNLFFVIRYNQKELVAQKNETLKLQITRVKNQLRKKLQANEDDLGFNVQGLKFVKQQWNLRHNFEFVDEYEQKKEEEKGKKKRVFETLV